MEDKEYCQEISAEVGEWYEDMGTYCVAEIQGERCQIKVSLTEQGCVLKLVSPGSPEVDVYVERLGDSNKWRLNLLSLKKEDSCFNEVSFVHRLYRRYTRALFSTG